MSNQTTRPVHLQGGTRPTIATPRLAEPGSAGALQVVGINAPFDVDAYHAMDQRDTALIADELLNGAQSSKFVYSFNIPGSGEVSGVSVIGARHLAAFYGKMKHRLVASVSKIGSLFTFQTFPGPEVPMSVHVAIINELRDEDDYYSCIVEVQDLNTGNSIQVERREKRKEKRRDGTEFARPNFETIAQSKAYRNAVLALVPQDTKLDWMQLQLKADKRELITTGVRDAKLKGIVEFCARVGVAIRREQLEGLVMEQIHGLSQAARSEEGVEAFKRAALSLGLLTAETVASDEHDEDGVVIEKPAPAASPGKAPGKTKPAAAAAPAPAPTGKPEDDFQFTDG